MFESRSFNFALGLILLLCFASPTLAFGAGNIASISKVEGQNWRHGDIEDALITLAMARAFGGKKFTRHNIARVYFGNWLRDYSQAVDVGTVKSVSAEAIRLLLSVLGFLTFGFGSREFEVTTDRLGCYRPEEHIDNPKNYADNVDARQYYPKLRGPVDERVELAIDRETGMKNYIANQRAGIMTSSELLHNLFGRCIELGRSYKNSQDKSERNEALRLLGTGLHCLEDFFAHSNYTELALIELGERNVFPHVGRNTRVSIPGARGQVYPIVTGTFGGVDFLHSVAGEVSDKLIQNEIEELEENLKQSQTTDTSILANLLDMIPDGIFGGKHQSGKINELQDNASAAQMQQMSVSPLEPEEYTLYVQNIFRQIMPAIEWHDEIMKSITDATEKIPVLPKILGQLEEQLSKFVFSLISPFVVPVINQIRNELNTGSNEIIESSEREQHIVFEDDESSDPTHSMLSKDHFTNILNEVAGRSAARMIQWTVPQIMDAIDDESIDPRRTIDRIASAVFCHPAQRDMGEDGAREGRQIIFEFVRKWWESLGDDVREDYRDKLSRDGVLEGRNHKEGAHDTGHGHGCNGKLEMRKTFGAPETFEDKIANQAADAILTSATGAFSGLVQQSTGISIPTYQAPQQQQEESSGGFLGAAASFLGNAFGGGDNSSSGRREQDSQSQSYSSQAYSSQQGGRSEYRSSEQDSYGSRTEYGSSEQQSESYGGGRRHGYGEEQQSYGGGGQRYGSQEESYGGRRHDREDEQESYGGRRHGREDEQPSYGGRQEYGQEQSYGRRQEYGQEQSYGGRQEYGQEQSYGRRQNYNQEQSYGGRQEYGQEEQSSYGRNPQYGGQGESQSYGNRGGYGEESSYGRGDGGYERRYGGGDDDENEGGRRHHRRRNDDEDEYQQQSRW